MDEEIEAPIDDLEAVAMDEADVDLGDAGGSRVVVKTTDAVAS